MPYAPIAELQKNPAFLQADRGAQIEYLSAADPKFGESSPEIQNKILDKYYLSGSLTADQTPAPQPTQPPPAQMPPPQMQAPQPTPNWFKDAYASAKVAEADFMNAATLGYGDDIYRGVNSLFGKTPHPAASMDPALVRQYWQQQGATPFAPQIPFLNATPAKLAGDFVGFNALGRLPFLNQMKGIPKLAAEGAAYGALAQPEGQDSLQTRLGNALSMGAGGAALGLGGKILGKVSQPVFNAAREFVQGPAGFDGVRTLQAGVRQRVNAAQQMADPQLQQEVIMRLRNIQEAITQQGGNPATLNPLAKRLQQPVTQKQLKQYGRFIQRMENMPNVQTQNSPRGVGSGGQLQQEASLPKDTGLSQKEITGTPSGAQRAAIKTNQAVAPEGTGAKPVATGATPNGKRTLEGLVKQYGFDTVDAAKQAASGRVLKTARQARAEISAETDPVRLRNQLLKAAAELGEETPASLRKTLAAKIKKLNKENPNNLDIAQSNALLDELNLRRTKLKASKLDSHPNLSDVLKSEFDVKTGLGKQIPAEDSLLTLDAVGPALKRYGPRLRGYAKTLEQAAQEDKAVKMDYNAEAVGHTSRGGRQQEFSPKGFKITNDGQVMVVGYNENRHWTSLHLHEGKGKKVKLPVLNEQKQITGYRDPSAIVSEPVILDKPAYEGPRAGAYKEAGEYTVEDALNAPTREEAIAKRDLNKVSIQASMAMDNIIQQARAAELPEPMLTKLADVAKERGATVSDFKAIKRYLEDNKVLKIMCSILGLGQKAS